MTSVLYDHQFFPVLPYSGISRYFYEIVSRISRMDNYKLSLFMGYNDCGYDFASVAPRLHAFFSRPKPRSAVGRKIASHRVGSQFKRFARVSRPQIYHPTYYEYLLPEFTGKRIITVFDLIYFLFPDFFDPSTILKQTRRNIDSAAGIIAISESTKRDLLALIPVPAERVRVIYLGNSLTLPPTPTSPIDGPYILFVGQRFGWKNFLQVLGVFCTSRLRKDFKLACFGGAAPTADEREIIRRHGAGRDVVFLRGGDAELATAYTHARLFVCPSLYEGFGMPVIEAMHYGCPVAASRSSSIPEIGGDAVAYFTPTDADEIREVLEKAAFDDLYLKQLAARGSVRQGLFSWDKCAAETAAFYRDLAV